jgi:hypothetical protein
MSEERNDAENPAEVLPWTGQIREMGNQRAQRFL